MVKSILFFATIAIVLIFAVISTFTINFETIEIYPVDSDIDTYSIPVESQPVAETPLI